MATNQVPMKTKTCKQRGAALILTLVAITIVAILGASIGQLVLTHYESATSDQDAVRALQLAEAGLNFQAQRLSASANRVLEEYKGSYSNTATHGTPVNPLVITDLLHKLPVNDLQGTQLTESFRFDPKDTLTCRTWIQRNAANGTLLPIDIYGGKAESEQFLYSEASVNGVQRTLRVRTKARGVFDRWACFGIDTLDLHNSNITIDGPIGTNNLILRAKNIDTSQDSLQVTIHGLPNDAGGASDTKILNNRAHLPTPSPRLSFYRCPVGWPTISQIANQNALYLQAYNQVPPPYATKAGFTTNNGISNFFTEEKDPSTDDDDVNYNDNGSAVYRAANGDVVRDANGKVIKFPKNGTIPSGATLTLYGSGYGANYYMTGLNVGGSQGKIVVDDSSGPVTLWINSSSTGTDETRGGITLTAGGTISDFRIYYRNFSGGRLRLNNSSTVRVNVPAMIYAYDRNDAGTVAGTLEVSGAIDVQGNLIANTLDLNGNVAVAFQGNTGATPGEGLLFFGFTTPWEELKPLRGK